jgi:hypothetical protein
MATPAQNVKLPVKFAVEVRFNNRVGFCLVRTDQDRGTNTYDILLRENSDNRFYNIETYVPLNTPAYTQNIKKRQEHRVNWSYTMKQLTHEQRIIPIIKFTPKVHLPSIAAWSFVPIVERGQPAVPVPVPAPLPAPAPAPIPAVIVEPKLPIKEIPNHAIRLLLLGAVIEGEECPISGTAIDATNGSVTSCFHLFERDSIARWLALPHTNKKCPVCMQACDLYLLP